MKKIVWSIFSLVSLVCIFSCDPKEATVTPFEPLSASKVTGKSSSQYSSAHIQEWIKLSLFLTQRNRGFTPMVAARAYCYVSLAAYESTVYGSVNYYSLQKQAQGLNSVEMPDVNKEYHWAAVSNAAISRAVKYFYINDYSKDSTSGLERTLGMIDSLNNIFVSQFKTETTLEVVNRSVEYGNKVADEIIAYSKTDGQEFCWKDENNFPQDFIPPTGDDKWVAPKGTSPYAMQPKWGSVRTYSVKNASIGSITPPYPYSEDTTSLFFKEAKETFDVSIKCLNPKADPENEKLNIIAQYWNDEAYRSGTPAGHSLSIARQIMTKEKMPLDKASELYVKMGMSLHDAFVYCWKVKYFYNLIRPITYIRKLTYFKQPNFNTLIVTPPFPEYTSGHSTQTGAAMETMTSVMGDNYSFTDSTQFIARFDLPDNVIAPRSFTSFYNCANEVSSSRIYGGIHFRKACEEGLRTGKIVAQNVLTMKFKK